MAADEYTLLLYLGRFAELHRNQHPRLGSAPHKPILLLAILDGIENASIRENYVRLTPELVASFRTYWRVLVPEDTWSDRIVYPFRYLVHERFWVLVKNGNVVPASDLGHPTSIGQFSELVDAGRFNADLWELLQDHTARNVLRKTLLDTYFEGAAVAQVSDPLTEEARRLMEEARQVRFRKQPMPKQVRESDVAYLRHNLFPRVITGLYDHQCAVCRMGIRDNNGRTLVDAAHIMPFAEFGNDDPRNGLALCPNHHRGFDAGWFGITDAYTVTVSRRISGGVMAYVEEGARIALPTRSEFLPERAALQWHRKNILNSRSTQI